MNNSYKSWIIHINVNLKKILSWNCCYCACVGDHSKLFFDSCPSTSDSKLVWRHHTTQVFSITLLHSLILMVTGDYATKTSCCASQCPRDATPSFSHPKENDGNGSGTNKFFAYTEPPNSPVLYLENPSMLRRNPFNCPWIWNRIRKANTRNGLNDTEIELMQIVVTILLQSFACD